MSALGSFAFTFHFHLDIIRSVCQDKNSCHIHGAIVYIKRAIVCITVLSMSGRRSKCMQNTRFFVPKANTVYDDIRCTFSTQHQIDMNDIISAFLRIVYAKLEYYLYLYCEVLQCTYIACTVLAYYGQVQGKATDIIKVKVIIQMVIVNFQ